MIAAAPPRRRATSDERARGAAGFVVSDSEPWHRDRANERDQEALATAAGAELERDQGPRQGAARRTGAPVSVALT